MARCGQVFHAVGNHELYNWKREGLASLLGTERRDQRDDARGPKRPYYSFLFQPGWRFVMLDSYEVCLMAPEGGTHRKEAEAILRKHNPKVVDPKFKGNYFEGLEGLNLRFVPFNGGVSAEQLRWLRDCVQQSSRDGERVVVFTHIPLSLEGTSGSARTLLFNYDAVLDVLHASGCVVAVFAGHHHPGSYGVDKHGLHHVTVQSPLTHARGAFGVVNVFRDRLEIEGHGDLPSRTLRFPEAAASSAANATAAAPAHHRSPL